MIRKGLQDFLCAEHCLCFKGHFGWKTFSYPSRVSTPSSKWFAREKPWFIWGFYVSAEKTPPASHHKSTYGAVWKSPVLSLCDGPKDLCSDDQTCYTGHFGWETFPSPSHYTWVTFTLLYSLISSVSRLTTKRTSTSTSTVGRLTTHRTIKNSSPYYLGCPMSDHQFLHFLNAVSSRPARL
jgi:hypothetical protein